MSIAFGLPAAAQAQNTGDITNSAVTVHNGGFGVVRETFDLNVSSGVTPVSFTNVAAHLEPNSVILRDVSGRRPLQILEQNYRNDPISQPLLLSLFEGETIDFLVHRNDGEQVTVKGKIIRSGYVPHQAAWQQYGQAYYQRQVALQSYGAGQPIIEVDGQLRFSMPGQPIFPRLMDDTILKPTLHWLLETDRPGQAAAEITYLTGGMRWEADYNLVAPEDSDEIEIAGWVTIDNNSGRTFENASLKLMAGDVSKLQPAVYGAANYAADEMAARSLVAPVSEKSFDEYHLYTIARPTTLRDRETKQIEFMRAEGVKAERIYVYDGAFIDPNRYRGWNIESIRQDRGYGTVANPKVWVMREFENSEDNNLGMPLPKGRARFYRQDGRDLAFVGENMIDHTPRDETVRVYTGNAFDLVGEREQTDYRIDNSADWLDESFRIKLRNHKEEAVEVIVVEHLYRWVNWEIRNATMQFEKTNSRTIEFRVPLEPGEEKVLTYTAHYTW
ncbi:MAG: hypothetical protein R3282_06775 [Rhodothermales bacterium]|nr:hypothetical protein [Rhodothermales bacterium]